MMKRFTLVDLVMTVMLLAIILCVGFVEGGNYIAAGVCMVVTIICALIAKREGGME